MLYFSKIINIGGGNVKKGERIRMRREELGISQTALSELIGESKQTLYKYETGIISNIPSDKIEALADILKVSPSWIMGWTDDKSGSAASLPSGNFPLSKAELCMIEKFRSLDARGQSAVLNVLEHEYQAISGDGSASSLSQQA